MKKIILIFIILFISASLSSCSLLPVEEEPLPAPIIKSYTAVEYKFAIVEKSNLVKYIDVVAQKIPAREEHLSFTVGQTLYENIYVNLGDQVKEGDILAELSKGDLEKQLDALSYNMSQLLLKRRQTEEALLLERKYAGVSPLNEEAYEKTLNDYDTQIKLLQIDIDMVSKKINERILTATMDGNISYLKKTSDGDRSVEDERFITITDSSISIFSVTGSNSVYFIPGNKELMKIGQSEFFEVIVAEPSETGIYKTNDNTAYFAFTEAMPEVINSTYATIRHIIEEKNDVLCLPVKAINKVNGETFVYILNNNIREMLPVEIGLTDSRGYVEILSALEEGDSVIIP